MIFLEVADNLHTWTWFRIRSFICARHACRKIAVLSLIRSQRQPACEGLYQCSGRDGTDVEFEWNENWSENHQLPALVPWLPYLQTHKEAPVDSQPPSSRLGVGTEVAELDNGPMAARELHLVDGRFRVRCLPGEHFQQRCQAYRSKLMVVRNTYGELYTVMQNRILCSPTDTSPVNSPGAFCKTP